MLARRETRDESFERQISRGEANASSSNRAIGIGSETESNRADKSTAKYYLWFITWHRSHVQPVDPMQLAWFLDGKHRRASAGTDPSEDSVVKPPSSIPRPPSPLVHPPIPVDGFLIPIVQDAFRLAALWVGGCLRGTKTQDKLKVHVELVLENGDHRRTFELSALESLACA